MDGEVDGNSEVGADDMDGEVDGKSELDGVYDGVLDGLAEGIAPSHNCTSIYTLLS